MRTRTLLIATLAALALSTAAAQANFGFTGLPSTTQADELFVHGWAPADGLVRHGQDTVLVEAGAFCFRAALVPGFNLVTATLLRPDGTTLRWGQPVIRTHTPVPSDAALPVACDEPQASR